MGRSGPFAWLRSADEERTGLGLRLRRDRDRGVVTIQGMIGACVDDERMLARAARMVDPERRRALNLLAGERVSTIDELRASGRTLHSNPHARGSLMGAVRGAMLEAWVFTVGMNAGDVLGACRRSQERTEAAFAKNLTQTWPKETRALLTEQMGKVDDARQRLIGIQYGPNEPVPID